MLLLVANGFLFIKELIATRNDCMSPMVMRCKLHRVTQVGRGVVGLAGRNVDAEVKERCHYRVLLSRVIGRFWLGDVE